MTAHMTSRFGLVSAALLAATIGTSAPAQDNPFAGQTFRLIVPHTAGRGLDSYARMIAPYLVKHSGAAGFTVENMVGAAGTIGNNAMWASEPDGLTLSFTALASVVLADLSGNEGVQYQIGDLTYLARSSAQPRLFLTGVPSGITTPEELVNLDRAFIYPAHGADEDFYTMSIFAEAIGLDLTIVTGYEGAGDSNLSVFSGDTDGLMLAATQAAPIIAAGDFIPILSMTSERSPSWPDLPTPTELLSEPNPTLEAMVAILDMDRGFLAPPNMDPALVDRLRDIMDAVHTDPELIAQAEAVGLPIIYMGGAELEAAIDDVMAVSDTIIPALGAALDSLQ